MTFKQWLRQIDPSKVNEIADHAERQREMDEDVSIDEHFKAKANH
jgi:hypothetical protein